MGTWGDGVFDSDAACDVRDEELMRLRSYFQAHVETGDFRVEDIEHFVAALAMYTVLLKHCGGEPPPAAAVRFWRDKMLEVFDRDFDQLDPSGQGKGPRRLVIERTFADLQELANR